MKQAVEFEDVEVDDVPVSALVQVRRENRYGGVPDLDDEELADPEELEKQALAEEWGPVLALPSKGGRGRAQQAVDESGEVDWGAFATVDFERTRATAPLTCWRSAPASGSPSRSRPASRTSRPT